ncbi:MAG: hypothetical protein R2755_24115 [Acidimicrobiales bacterium]
MTFRSFSGRTRLATAAAIVAIGVTGAAAVGANVGILDSSSETSTGELSAGGALPTASTQVVDVFLDGSTTSTAATSGSAAASPVTSSGVTRSGEPLVFAVDAAGTVSVAGGTDGLRLESVAPAAGWTWTLSQAKADLLHVSFTNGSRTLDFWAARRADGGVDARVDEPVVVPAPASPSGSSGSSGSTYRDDDDHEDDHEDDHGVYENEHEGEDDDD